MRECCTCVCRVRECVSAVHACGECVSAHSHAQREWAQ